MMLGKDSVGLVLATAVKENFRGVTGSPCTLSFGNLLLLRLPLLPMSQGQSPQLLQVGGSRVCDTMLDRHLAKWMSVCASGAEEQWARDAMQWLVSFLFGMGWCVLMS